MIAHRASCFEENTGVFWKNNKAFPAGKRSDWVNRHKLCVSKLACRVNKAIPSASFPRILLDHGRTQLEDDFVEVQVFGPMTARTLESVTISSKHLKGKRTYWKAVKVKLVATGVKADET